jgi:hypothetical protein
MLRKGEHDGKSASVRYLVAYRYEPFVDAKYANVRPSGTPTWGRVSFEIVCPACGERGAHSVQTNKVRPSEGRCPCGAVLFREERETPLLTCVDGRAA